MPEYRNGIWKKFTFGVSEDWLDAEAWFRANCPPDRFVTDEGEVLRFEMLDDGRARAARCDGRTKWETNLESYGGDTMEIAALYRFRDAERVKWTFSLSSPPKTNSHYVVARKYDGREWILGPEGWRTDAGEALPAWVRNQAEALYRENILKLRAWTEALYREKNPEWDARWRPDLIVRGENRGVLELLRSGEVVAIYESGPPSVFPAGVPRATQIKAIQCWNEHRPKWRVEWWSENNAGPASAIYKGDEYWGKLNRDGFKWKCAIALPPDHILTQARAKFRENYQLKRDEAWARDQVIKLKFENDEQGARVVVGPSYFWGENSVRSGAAGNKSWGYLITKDESERLELFDRASRFFYEEHPERCWSESAGGLTFRIEDGQGIAGNEEHPHWFCSRTTFDPADKRCDPNNRVKLRAWTEAQLKKREGENPGKVVFEGELNDSLSVRHEGMIHLWRCGDADPIGVRLCDGRYRVTIEPLGGE